MEVTINISPELQAWLQIEAARKGIDAQGYIIDTLQEHLHKARQTPYLARSEADLLHAKVAIIINTSTQMPLIL